MENETAVQKTENISAQESENTPNQQIALPGGGNAEAETDNFGTEQANAGAEIDIENEYIPKESSFIADRAAEKGMTAEEYSRHLEEAEINSLIVQLMESSAMSRKEAEREAKYQLQEEKIKRQERIASARMRYISEIKEFKELYPDVEEKRIPNTVWEEVKKGIPLSSAYAAYERKMYIKKARADKVNTENTQKAVPSVKPAVSAEERIYTYDELRKMSRSEINENYDAVIRSISKMNK